MGKPFSSTASAAAAGATAPLLLLLLLVLCFFSGGASSMANTGACCSDVNLRNTRQLCVEKINANECLTKMRGVYIGDNAQCNSATVQICKKMRGACCGIASQCNASTVYEECEGGHFAGYGVPCSACPRSAATYFHLSGVSADTTGKENVRTLLSGTVRDLQQPQVVVSSATVMLLSRTGVKVATTKVNEFGEYEIQVLADDLQRVVTAAYAPFKVYLSENALSNYERQRCYRSEAHVPFSRVRLGPPWSPPHIDAQEMLAEKNGAKRDLFVVCADRQQQHAEHFHDDDDDSAHEHSSSSDHHDDDDDDHHHRHRHSYSGIGWAIGLFFVLCVFLLIAWFCWYAYYDAEYDVGAKRETSPQPPPQRALVSQHYSSGGYDAHSTFDNVLLSQGAAQQRQRKK